MIYIFILNCAIEKYFLSKIKCEIFHMQGHVSYNLSDNSLCFELLQHSIMYHLVDMHLIYIRTLYFPASYHCVLDVSKQEKVSFYFALIV